MATISNKFHQGGLVPTNDRYDYERACLHDAYRQHQQMSLQQAESFAQALARNGVMLHGEFAPPTPAAAPNPVLLLLPRG